MLLALVLPGCMTGHLLDAARRRERAVAFRAASVDGDRLLLDYTALVTDDLGAPLARRPRRAAVALADLARGDQTLEALPVEPLADDAPLAGEPAALEVGGADGRPGAVVVRDAGGRAYPPFSPAALTRSRTAPWVYPLVPFAVVFDAATTPVLVFFAPAVLLTGD